MAKRFVSIPAQNVYFQEEELQFSFDNDKMEGRVVNLFSEVEYQEMLGFGGAFTESAAYNYAQLTDEQKESFMKSLFTRKEGIGYNFARMHINSCDFSLDIYSYVEKGDMTLETFDLSRDEKYIIPMVKDALKYTDEEIFLFASPWSPPDYMKENESPIRGGALKEEYKAVWGRYYAKYIQEMAKRGITISAITIQNEPKHCGPWESCYYSAAGEREFIEKYLVPALDEAGLSHIKIIVWDHNKERVYDRAKKLFESKTVYNRVWAIGHHWYSGDHFDGIRIAHEKFNKPLISTEICGDINADVQSLAERYGKELIGDANNFTAAFCDWNLMLSDKGGPFHNRNAETVSCAGIVYEDKSSGCYAPILFDTEKRELIYTPIYYYIGHLSKFVEKGAVRLGTSSYHEKIRTAAFRNPNGTIVMIIMNEMNYEMSVNLRYNDDGAAHKLPPHSIETIVID